MWIQYDWNDSIEWDTERGTGGFAMLSLQQRHAIRWMNISRISMVVCLIMENIAACGKSVSKRKCTIINKFSTFMCLHLKHLRYSNECLAHTFSFMFCCCNSLSPTPSLYLDDIDLNVRNCCSFNSFNSSIAYKLFEYI